MKDLVRLVDQTVWANRLWIEHVHARPDLDARPRELLAHILLGERVWFERVAGEPKGQLAAHYAKTGSSYPSTDHIDFLMANRL